MRIPTTIEITTQDDDLIESCRAAWSDSSIGGHVTMGGKKWSVVSVEMGFDRASQFSETHTTCRIQLMEILEVQDDSRPERTLRDGRLPREIGRR